MLSRVMFNIVKCAIRDNTRALHRARDLLQQSGLPLYNDNRRQHLQDQYSLYIVKRFKSSKRKKATHKQSSAEDSDSDDDKDDGDAPVGSKVTTVNVQSIRLDAISKIGFGMSRNKIEEAFYESKIRINGKKVFKKSKELEVGAEVDLIIQRDKDNPKLLVVNRMVILSMKPVNDMIQIKLSRDRNLTIEDYEMPWQSE